MGVPLFEQETVINIMRDENIAHICTSDSTIITKLEHRCKANPDEWKKVDENPDYKFYECPKNFISFRSKKIVGRERTEEEKRRSAEALAKYREHKRQESNSESIL